MGIRMLGKRKIPVYLFTGFLDGGKTTFIKETLQEGQFQDGKTTLLILCEEGEEELSDELLQKNKMVVKTVEDEEDISLELFSKYESQVHPHRVMIEANGMWDVKETVEAFPPNWEMAEGITPVDASTFETYLSNMKQMMTNQFTYSDLVVFNRCLDSYDRAMFKRMVRAVNKRAQILFETPDGKVDDQVDEELPFDLDASIIEIGDDDFGIWYLDALDNLETYIGKKVQFKAIVYIPRGAKQDVFVPGRFAMTCCAEDVAFIGFPCKFDETKKMKQKSWVMVTATVQGAMSREYGKKAPVLYAEKVEPAEKAAEEIVYFN